MWFKRARTDKTRKSMGFVALTRMIVSAYTSSLSLSSSSAQEGGGSAIKEGAIKIDRSVTIGVVGRSFERASERATLVKERERRLDFELPLPILLRIRRTAYAKEKTEDSFISKSRVPPSGRCSRPPRDWWPLHQPESPIQIFVSLSFTILSRVGSFGGV